MSVASEIINEQVRPRAISLRWIINAREDLVWFIGSVASSYALLVLYVTGIVPLIPMVAGWAILIDAPHVFGTFSRTYFDASEWKTRKRLMLGSLLFFAVGPAMVLLGVGFTFFFIAALWAYYHLVKQHYGFMVLYKKKNNDLAPVDNALDRLLLMFAFNYPFVAFIANDPSAMARVPTILRSGVNGFAILLLIGTVVLGVASVYHNLQYHRLIWFHNQKYSGTGVPPVSHAQDARTTYGPAAFISRRLVYYIGFGIIFGIIYQGPRQYLGYLNLHTGDSPAALSLPIQLGIAFLWGYAFIHYYLDSKIWRVRRDPSVGKALNMT